VSIAGRPTEVGKLGLPAMIGQVIERASSASAQPDLAPPKPPRRSESLGWIIRRDFGWTVAIAVVTAAVYLLPFYGGTWGSLSDYGTAFAAGFLGKIGLQWAALPAFHTLRLRRKQAGEAAAGEPRAALPAAPVVEQIKRPQTNGTPAATAP
jgi:hypothetical protein